MSDLPLPPKCRSCNVTILNGVIGYFLHNPATTKFDLYCENCYHSLIAGKDTV